MIKEWITKYRVVEVPEGTRLPELTPDLKESLKTLQHNPAFQYLLMRQRLQRGRVQSYINEGFKLDDNELRFAQAGMYWLGFLERDYKSLIRQPEFDRQATVSEQDEFNRIAETLESIG